MATEDLLENVYVATEALLEDVYVETEAWSPQQLRLFSAFGDVPPLF